MKNPLDYPFLVLVVSLLVLWLSAQIGAFIFRRQRKLDEDVREEFGQIFSGTLTLLALIIGFIFLMAANRYDQRKNYEAEEANAIGTEYVRADLLPAADAQKVRAEARTLLLILPLVVSVSFFLIADIDSPRAGLIHVYPQNLASVVESVRAP